MLLIALLALTAADGNKSAMDDWTPATIVSIGSSSSDNAGSNYLVIQAGDLDGDGVSDDAYLKLACADGKLTNSWYQVKGPRDAGSGMPTGKRQHKPLLIVTEWTAAPPALAAVKPTYDIKTMKGTRASAHDDWLPILLRNTDGLCDRASAAARTIIKSKSNITNN